MNYGNYDVFSREDAFEKMKQRKDMPLCPYNSEKVKEHLTRLVTSIDADALAWCEYICTRDARCAKGREAIYPPDQPDHVFDDFEKWMHQKPEEILPKWGQPQQISVPLLPSTDAQVQWAYGDSAEFVVREINGIQMAMVKKQWNQPEMLMIPVETIVRSYIRIEDEQMIPEARVSLIPSRADDRVTGQMKIAIDVALMLPYMSPTDDVLVVGSANCNGIGESYHLLGGTVATVTCLDPQEVPMNYEMNGTRFVRHVHAWGEEIMQADVVFSDAWSPERGLIGAEVRARDFSLKVTAEEPGLEARWQVAQQVYPYRQVSRTNEIRLVSRPRNHSAPRHRLGSCPACVEVDSVWPREFNFNPGQRAVWRAMHRYGAETCTYMHETFVEACPLVHANFPRQVNAYIRQFENDGRKMCASIVTPRQLTEHDGLVEIAALANGSKTYIVTWSGPPAVRGRQLYDIGGYFPRVVPNLWSMWLHGRCAYVGNGFASLVSRVKVIKAERPFA